jgi:outer membrane protein
MLHKHSLHKQLAAVALAACFIAPGMAQAADFFVRAGAHNVDPKSDNGTLAGGALKADINTDWRPSLALGYYLNDNVAVEVLAALPFKHEVTLNGAGAVDFKHLPPTVSLQYYFAPGAKVNPYLGAGVNYTWTYDEKSKGPVAGTRIGIENSWGLAAQGGLLFKMKDNLDLFVDVRYIDIDAKVKVDGANVGEVAVDPLVYGLGLSWSF